MMSGSEALKSVGQLKAPVSLEVWLRYQVESIPLIAAKNGHFSAHCAAASFRLKLRGALMANLINAETAAELSEMLDKVRLVEEPA